MRNTAQRKFSGKNPESEIFPLEDVQEFYEEYFGLDVLTATMAALNIQNTMEKFDHIFASTYGFSGGGAWNNFPGLIHPDRRNFRKELKQLAKEVTNVNY
jgi:hypothetical protein